MRLTTMIITQGLWTTVDITTYQAGRQAGGNHATAGGRRPLSIADAGASASATLVEESFP
jgi:hypothetical protein